MTACCRVPISNSSRRCSRAVGRAGRSRAAASSSLADLRALAGARGRRPAARGRDHRHRALRGPLHDRRRDRRVLAVRVIPCLDVDAGRVVKGVRFIELRDAGDPVELAARYDAEGADELVFLDITASSDDRDTMVHIVERVADRCSSRSRSAAACAASRTCGACCAPAPTRSRSTPPRSSDPETRRGRGRRVRRAVHRRRDRRRAGATPMTGCGLGGHDPRRARARPASTRSSGPCTRATSAPARSCSRRWTATAPRPATTSSCCGRSATR